MDLDFVGDMGRASFRVGMSDTVGVLRQKKN